MASRVARKPIQDMYDAGDIEQISQAVELRDDLGRGAGADAIPVKQRTGGCNPLNQIMQTVSQHCCLPIRVRAFHIDEVFGAVLKAGEPCLCDQWASTAQPVALGSIALYRGDDLDENSQRRT
jgi:hypothetical protein